MSEPDTDREMDAFGGFEHAGIPNEEDIIGTCRQSRNVLRGLLPEPVLEETGGPAR